MRHVALIIALVATQAASVQPASAQTTAAQNAPVPGASPIIIPLGGNAWGDTVYFRLSHTGRLDIAAPDDVTITLGQTTHTIPENNTASWTIVDTGYQKCIVRSKTPIQTITLSGPATASPMAYVPNNQGNFFYWGRRGPSVHLNYPVDNSINVEYFYNELTVPKGLDRTGSYFMAAGFSVGYFGMQVNGPAERRILFSVWSPFTTDDPKSIPDSLKIVLIKKGAEVHAGAFGDEGAGGQSYLVYPWIAGTTYRFLLRAEPQTDNHTRFTAWFFAPEQNQWQLIACWSRPATRTWLTRLHSFLENFEPEQGDKDRLCYYSNQWICDADGHWTPLTRARFTGDNTARKNYRLDYSGGTHDSAFFLRNGGFFNQPTPLDSWFQHPAPRASAPPVDFATLRESISAGAHTAISRRLRTDTLVTHFAFDRSGIRAADSVALSGIKKNADSILIIGYTDTVGSNSYNDRLSYNRALATKTAIRQFLAAASAQLQPPALPIRLEARGKCEPLPGDDSMSRRVETIVFYHLPDTPVVAAIPPHVDSPKVHPDDEPDTAFGMDNINFVANTPNLTDAAREALPGQVPYLRSLSLKNYLEIDGFCNQPGPPLKPTDILFILSIKRARFIYDYLVGVGLDSTHLRYRGMGNTNPINAHPTTAAEMDKNMRVEIRVFRKPPPQPNP